MWARTMAMTEASRAASSVKPTARMKSGIASIGITK